MKSLLGSLAILIILFPWFSKSIADRSIDVNGLLVNLFETVTEIITREPANWQNPTPPAAQPPQQPKGGV
ncbi:hypothetical protein NDI52_24710 [Leptolyngbya sp. PL-A3]|uniref:hypothetical protein n=1 Tax=Leptolyngbya sp. PL-A3 TaxID=2933911 RepID=UPI0032997F3F